MLRGCPGAQLYGPLAGLERGVAGDEVAIAAAGPEDRHPVLPHAEEETATADLVGGHLVRQHHRGVGVHLEDETVEAIEKGPELGGDGVDVVPCCVVHGQILSFRPVSYASLRICAFSPGKGEARLAPPTKRPCRGPRTY